jgi:hypothetical protein
MVLRIYLQQQAKLFHDVAVEVFLRLVMYGKASREKNAVLHVSDGECEIETGDKLWLRRKAS